MLHHPFSNSFPIPSQPRPDECLSDYSLTKLTQHHVGLPLLMSSETEAESAWV